MDIPHQITLLFRCNYFGIHRSKNGSISEVTGPFCPNFSGLNSYDWQKADIVMARPHLVEKTTTMMIFIISSVCQKPGIYAGTPDRVIVDLVDIN